LTKNLVYKKKDLLKSIKDRVSGFSINNHVIEISIIVFLVGMNVIIGSYLRENLLDIIWVGDDAIHIGVAKSFSENGSFVTPFTRVLGSFSVDYLIETYPKIEFPQITKGPIHYILLGSFFKLMGTNVEDFYLHASIFSNILTSIFLIIFFFWIRTRFSLIIALFSSILILLLPFFIYTSARVYLYPTLFIFSISALFFLERKI